MYQIENDRFRKLVPLSKSFYNESKAPPASDLNVATFVAGKSVASPFYNIKLVAN
jgi:hypothetical protein